MSRVYPFTAVWCCTGQPGATIPAGFTSDVLPIGATLIAPPNGEKRLLSIAARLEEVLAWSDHRPPLESLSARRHRWRWTSLEKAVKPAVGL